MMTLYKRKFRLAYDGFAAIVNGWRQWYKMYKLLMEKIVQQEFVNSQVVTDVCMGLKSVLRYARDKKECL